ncbi:PEPxxWA-CTERM sorting domain-containing protein [Methylobacillus arboreus]|uniref:PEP-CTERM sorting domain-containing protein n=1 Tax=Methylobacillus arboreus TaxID=755170 RepID=UPI001E464C74|nr:PEP-CTERM sorting domain-containing protein [Methylobacillus arboreus]MCB5189563.1 PEPxxWA-CTERM sorting domain-containing protein [Methylobacillus arboreus]
MNLKSVQMVLVGASLFAMAGLAQANATHDSFIDVAGSVSFDGWNQLNRNRLDADGNADPLTSAQLAAGTAGNVAGSGDALLTLLSGSYYPAGAGLYGSNNALTFTDNTIASDISSIAFQGIINDFDGSFGGTPFSLTLSYNGGDQDIAGTLVNFVDTGTAADYYYYTWDLSGISTPISSYTLNFDIGFSQSLAFQVDQVAAVPEPETYAMLLLGLGAIGFAARRRSKFN